MFDKLENLKLKYKQKVTVLWWAENETIFRKCRFLRIFPKYKYDPRESTIYLPFDMKKNFDKVLGNFENL